MIFIFIFLIFAVILGLWCYIFMLLNAAPISLAMPMILQIPLFSIYSQFEMRELFSCQDALMLQCINVSLSMVMIVLNMRGWFHQKDVIFLV